MAVTRARDPRAVAPVGSYMTDGVRLCRVMEADASGAILEDQACYQWVEVSVIDLMQKWRHVRSDSEDGRGTE